MKTSVATFAVLIGATAPAFAIGLKTAFIKALRAIAAAGASLWGGIKRHTPVRAPGPTTTPNINALLLHLCNGDHDKALFVLRWLAYPLRSPNNSKLTTALWVRGGQGAGKSLFFGSVVRALYSHVESATVDDNALRGAFNGWLMSKRYVLVDDFDHKRGLAEIKHLLTSDKLRIDRKGQERTLVRNKANFVLLSGDKDVLPFDPDNRRFFILDAPAALPPAFYKSVLAELNSGGAETFGDWLRNDLDMIGTNHAKTGTAALEVLA
jgi:putative DNA primase/helicase